MAKIESNYIELHVFNRTTGKFLLLKRASHKIYPGTWQMITASCEEGESTKETAVRELFEETGIKKSSLFAAPHVNTSYFYINNSIYFYPVFLAVVSTDEVLISDEHTEYKWVTYFEAVKLIHWPDQIESLNVIWRYLNDENLKYKLVELDVKGGKK